MIVWEIVGYTHDRRLWSDCKTEKVGENVTEDKINTRVDIFGVRDVVVLYDGEFVPAQKHPLKQYATSH